LNRTATLVVDVPYIWNFHKLPSESRFHIVLHDVVSVEAMKFYPWPGETIMPDGLTWNEQQSIRTETYAKGYLSSSEWASFDEKLKSGGDYEFSNAYLSTMNAAKTKFIGEIGDSSTNDYVTVRITADRMSFLIDPNQPMTLDEFLALGKAYWDDFADRASKYNASS